MRNTEEANLNFCLGSDSSCRQDEVKSPSSASCDFNQQSFQPLQRWLHCSAAWQPPAYYATSTMGLLPPVCWRAALQTTLFLRIGSYPSQVSERVQVAYAGARSASTKPGLALLWYSMRCLKCFASPVSQDTISEKSASSRSLLCTASFFRT
jgi:hypothetical protein